MDVARRILLAMTTAQGTRRARPEGELVPIDPRAAAMLERLERARLVVREADGVTLAHEALLVQWGRLRGWIEGAREDRLLAEALERDAREWEGGHGVEPWKKRRLAAARDLVRYGEEDLSDAARAFVRAGQAAERRGTIALATVTATVIVSLGIAAVYSLTQARKATAALADAYAAQAVVLSADPGRELDALALAFKSAALGPSRPELAQRAMAETALAADRAGLSRSVPLGDHDVDVNTVVVSPDGRLVATAADDGSIHTWDLNGAPLGAVRGQPGSVTMLAISPDSARVASMGTHGDLRIRELATGREVAAVTVKLDSADEGRVRVRYAPDGAVFVRSLGSGSVQTFDGSTLKEVAPPVARSVAVSIDGRRAVVVEKDAFSVIDVRTGATLRRTIRPDASTFPYDVTDSGAVASSTGSSVDRWTVDGQITPGPALNAPARFVRISASGERAFASVENGRGFNGGVLVDFAAHKLVTLSDYGESIFEAKWTRDGRRILTQGALTMHVWEATTGALEARISPPGNLKAAAITADGSRVAIATTDGARLWEVPPESGFEHHANSDQPFFATYLPGGDRIVTVGTDAIEWDAHSGALIHKLAGAGTPQSAVVASDGDSLVVATRTPERAIEWQVWQLKPPSLTATILAAGPVSPASMSADGDTLAGVCRNGGACIWNASDGKLRQRISANDQDVLDAAISPDGQLVAISRLDKTVEIARTTDGAQRAMLTGHTDAVRGAVFSGDGRSVVTWGDDRTARLWSIDGSLRHVFAGHSRRVLSAALAADGSRLMTAAEDHRAILWDTVSGAKLGTVYDWTTRWGNETSGLVLDEGSLEPERWNALHSPFSADGTSVAVPTRNGSTVILDAATGDVRMTVRGAGSKAFTFTFAPDGGHGVAVSTDANVRVVPIATHDFMAVGCFVLDGQKLLTPEERRMCDQAIHGIPEVAPSLAPDYLGYGYVSVTGR
jgi:WD40 repeat protein